MKYKEIDALGVGDDVFWQNNADAYMLGTITYVGITMLNIKDIDGIQYVVAKARCKPILPVAPEQETNDETTIKIS